ncbi:cytochrome P450 [Myxococcus qinghaiensis]|uniref:cytochrome P450 n=1 Tax=Myxococcus qinghaiensis TaxID=2906758 RepID=UPI0020A77622|nr:cytochrome P450 [Myxococcus qinghaiensis]MCP3163421.1 cytochrome P450 [Myxococcus qinghaiensis]
MMELFTDDVRRNPFPLYAKLRAASPLLHEPQADLWILFDYDSVRRALHDHEAFSSIVATETGTTPDWLLFSDPPRHTKLRNIIMRAFTPRSIANLEPHVQTLSRELLDVTVERGEMDLVTDYSSLLPAMVIAKMIGIPPEDRARFLRWGDVIMKLSYTIADGEESKRAMEENSAARNEMRTYLADILDERRRVPRDDLLTRLVEAEVDGERLDGKEILGFFQLLLAAGTETTTNLINNALLCFMEYPDQLARLRAEPALLASAIEEVLRFRSPAQSMFRSTKRDVELHGQVIPAGKFVLPMIGSANRDPKHFHEPERFDIGRDPNPHIAFGHGIHFCLGAALSRMEARVALTDLLERLRNFRLASDEPWQPRQALHVHGPTHLPLRFEPGARS